MTFVNAHQTGGQVDDWCVAARVACFLKNQMTIDLHTYV